MAFRMPLRSAAKMANQLPKFNFHARIRINIFKQLFIGVERQKIFNHSIKHLISEIELPSLEKADPIHIQVKIQDKKVRVIFGVLQHVGLRMG
ncbi:MAG: hypothetical protein BWY44_00035 [Candidatus Omnitrophica bacterium ADurb.Bin292]|nr:MAG: hypothetical protein BWY44_00035 [Candidatus Omnitrophica bacterium ADurb.Bin292]